MIPSGNNASTERNNLEKSLDVYYPAVKERRVQREENGGGREGGGVYNEMGFHIAKCLLYVIIRAYAISRVAWFNETRHD